MVRELSELIGKTLSRISRSDDEIIFETTEGEAFKMYHQQDCCESVRIEDIAGELNSLLNHPVLLAEERSNSGEAQHGDTYTWTFYEISTIKGNVTIRWYGSSNGYYSERVDFVKIK